MSEERVIKSGNVIWFNSRTGFGFIDQDDSEEDLFLHWSNIEIEGFKTVNADQRVSYCIGENNVGKQAVNVNLEEGE